MIRRLVMAAIAVSLLAATQDGSRWWGHVQYLADDKLEGRNTGSAGHRQAAAYVAGEFERAGLEPAGIDGYLQPVRLHARRLVEDQSSLALIRGGVAEPLTLGEDAIIGTRVDPASLLEAPVVFAGYALTVPEMVWVWDSAPSPLNVALASGASVSVPEPVNGTAVPLAVAVPLSVTVAVWPLLASPAIPACRSNDAGGAVATELPPPPQPFNALTASSATRIIAMLVCFFI